MSEQVTLTSTRPYLIRAIYQWIEDNELTPYMLVDASVPDVDVPREYIRNDRIVLNTSSIAVRHLLLENDKVQFSAKFGGIARDLYIPIEAVLAIYAKENGKGLYFEQDGDIEPPPKGPRKKPVLENSNASAPASESSPSKGRAKLKVVK